ncbi:MAG: alpha/beta fold hydrolase, partial [Planctomycetes bacterium]|nr:alpha/beta fold hydrolase [Planctomycetota bacterium]
APKMGVVVVHGWTSCRMGPHQMLVKICRQLNREGMASLRFDLRGRGESEGDPLKSHLDGMISDTCAAGDFLRRESGAERLGIVGICSGGNVAIGAATLRDDVDSLALWSTLPFQPQRKVKDDLRRTGFFLTDYAKKAFRAETWKKLFGGKIHFKLIGRVLFGHYAAEKDAEGRNPKDSARDIMAEFGGYKGTALFMYGGNDPEAKGAHEVYSGFCAEKGIRSDFRFIPGANHNFYSLEWERQVIEQSVEWLKRG